MLSFFYCIPGWFFLYEFYFRLKFSFIFQAECLWKIKVGRGSRCRPFSDLRIVSIIVSLLLLIWKLSWSLWSLNHPRVRIMLVDVSLEAGTPCQFDYLQLEDASTGRRRFGTWVTKSQMGGCLTGTAIEWRQSGYHFFAKQEGPGKVLPGGRYWHCRWVRREYCQCQVPSQINFHFFLFANIS